MSEQAAFGVPDWIPPRSARMMLAEDAAERSQERAAKKEREDAEEARRERALQAYRVAADTRGEHVSAVALATGQVIGRTVGDVFADAAAAADRDDAREKLRQQRAESGELVHIEVEEAAIGRAAAYHDRLLVRRGGEMHQELVAYLARHDYAGAVEAARAKSSGGREASRYEDPRYAQHYGGREITRACDAGAIVR